MGGPERAATPPPLYGDGVYAVRAAADDDGDDALIVMITVMTIFSSSWYDTPPDYTQGTTCCEKSKGWCEQGEAEI